MAAQQSNFFDTFTGSEAERMKTIMAELDRVPWAQGILYGVQRHGGLVGKNMADFFELRFGHALHNAGVAVEYEVPGEGGSTLDFGFTSKGQPWKVEMMRLQETQAAKAATTSEVDKDGVQWTKQILTSDNKDKRQSGEGEMLKAVERICQKCELGGKPYKFPKPDKALHAILVDLRTFKNGGDSHDRLHIGLGGEYQGMAGAADIVEHELIVRPGAFSARILPERISADRHETGKRERELAKDHAAQ
jgi:hypothetical protein